jgi:hypothetical protein
VPSILVVMDAVWPELFARCLNAAMRSGVLVHRCDLPAAATFAAERRPVAIVMSNAVHALDPKEWNALARDVRTMLLRVDEEVTERELEAMFSGALRERERDDRGDGSLADGSRYALIRRTVVETTMPQGTQPQVSVRASSPSSPRLRPPGAAVHANPLPPPSHRFAAPPQSPQGPPSARAAPLAPTARASYPPPPAQSPTPSALSNSPPSVRSAALAQGSTPTSRQLPVEPPQSARKPPSPRPTPATPRSPAPFSVKGDPTPRSGVRQSGGDALDVAFDEQSIAIDGLARGRGSAT